MPVNHPSLVAMSTAGLALLATACLGASTETPPVITVQPADQVAAPGLTATFTVDATGTGSLSCQWAADGAPIDGATAWTYTTPAVTLADAGTVYAASVRDQGGAPVVSRGARLRVEGPIATGSLARARGGHAAVSLTTGEVLVVGGSGGSTYPSLSVESAELYHPASGSWSTTGPLAGPRAGFAALRLATGPVLAVGGQDNGSGLPAVTERYDPSSGTWSPSGELTTGRASLAAALLPSGEVLAVGGQGSDLAALASAERYDPIAARWTPTGRLGTPRWCLTATTLQTGQVLVVGGSNDGALASAELYDPATGSWSPTGSLAEARYCHTATLLTSGEVLVVGGWGASLDQLATAERYDPATGRWSSAGALAVARVDHAAARLASGEVLVFGGLQTLGAPAELYDPAARTWTLRQPEWLSVIAPSATLLPSGAVLLAGGYDRHTGPLSTSRLWVRAP
jgi:N-acetylneuraminic acid mutarotase